MSVAQGNRVTQRRRGEPSPTTEVEELGRPAEHRRDELGVAQQAAKTSRRKLGAVGEQTGRHGTIAQVGLAHEHGDLS
jgi:hypothetical protein